MRLRQLICWDIKFQAKYGFYFLYTVISVIYLVILFAFPPVLRAKAAAVMIFSDPAAMGLFFMGAIILFEKSQKVTYALSVSPVKATEYVCSKMISIGIVSVVVAAVLAGVAKADHIVLVLAGTALASFIFTLCGIIVATKVESLNQFFLATVPIEVIAFVPALFYFLTDADEIFGCYPPNTCIDLIAGRVPSVAGLVGSILLIVVLFYIAKAAVCKMWLRMGGVKL